MAGFEQSVWLSSGTEAACFGTHIDQQINICQNAPVPAIAGAKAGLSEGVIWGPANSISTRLEAAGLGMPWLGNQHLTNPSSISG